MKFDVEKFKAAARGMNESELQEMQYREENREWLIMSEKIALKLRYYIDIENISQSELAARMKVTPAQITKILSGRENLGLKTIAKIEKAIGKRLIDISLDVLENESELKESNSTPSIQKHL
jgi:plasmid maintenance system antidote protein VapI